MAVNESNAGFKPDHASDISRFCYRHAEDLKVCPKELTMDDVAAIGLYTLGFEKPELERRSPYRMINSALVAGTREKLEPVKDILYLVMTALRKLPIVHNKPLYRGIKSSVVYVGSQQSKGNSITTTTSTTDKSSSSSDANDLTMAPKVLSRIGNIAVESKEECKEGDKVLWRSIICIT